MELINPKSSVVVIGNGPSVMMQDQGKLIDCFDEVIRFNECRTTGVEQFTGTKTTIWCTFGRGMLPGDAHIRPSKVIMVHEGATPAYSPVFLSRIPRVFYDDILKEVVKTSLLKSKQKLQPSSGYLVLRWLFDVYHMQRVHITGFDHFKKDQDKRHHYWNPKAFGRPLEHDGDAEFTLLEPYVKQKQLFYLNHAR
jgi:hypothetical protein